VSETPIPEGCVWNECEFDSDNPLNPSLIALVVITSELSLRLIGTAFIIRAEGHRALAISAAHCLEEIRKILHPNPTHHASALPEFLPPPTAMELKSVKGLYLKNGRAYDCTIEVAVWDTSSDLATISVTAPPNEEFLFQDCFWLDDQIPREGDMVGMIGFGEMKLIPDLDNHRLGRIELRALLRVGTVESVHENGYFMVKNPCIETSIAIFSGMSGGLVARWTGNNTQIKAFALISHAPEPQPSFDRSESGHSVASILPLRKIKLSETEQQIELDIKNAGIGLLDTSKSYDMPLGTPSTKCPPRKNSWLKRLLGFASRLNPTYDP
jgi:hypothetical protein